MRILTKAEKIKSLLEEKAIYRDDYYSLVARVWYDELTDKSISAIAFLCLVRAKRVTHPESIMRARRKIQEEHPHLRGDSYTQRNEVEQLNVLTELGYGDTD